jgi:hypothetical protein
MKRFLPPILVVILGLATSISSYLLGRKAATQSIQAGLAELVRISREAAAHTKPEEDVLQDPPEAAPVEAEKQAEISLNTLESMRETAEPGSLRFDNPDVVNLLVQLRKRIEYIEDRERRLKELEDRVKLESQNLNLATQSIARAKTSQDQLLTQRMQFIAEEEQARLQEHARRLTALTPAQAVSILTNFTPVEIARTLMVVGSTNSASLLGALTATGPNGPRNAAEISKIMLRMTTRSTQGSTNAVPPAAK